MPSWNEVLSEIKASKRPDALDFVRRTHLLRLHSKRNRNIICYYSGWLYKPNTWGTAVDDNDKNGFMAAIHGLDRSQGLDLLLHTPGGEVAAAESLVEYLRLMFGTNIQAFIPQLAMSAGTMIACSCEKIYMGKQSSLGPIDPQLSGYPASGVIAEFDRATEEIKKDPYRVPLWQAIIGKYPPTFIGSCEHAISWSRDIVTNWLLSGMFRSGEDRIQITDKIVKELSDHNAMKTHARHLSKQKCIELGLKIVDLEEDNALQDLVLTVHHAYMHTLANSSAIKIIENHNGIATFLHGQPTKST